MRPVPPCWPAIERAVVERRRGIRSISKLKSQIENMTRTTFAAVSLLLSVLCLGADWLQFRGGDAGGAASVDLPIAWNVEKNENIAWKAALTGKGVSGPIVVAGKV